MTTVNGAPRDSDPQALYGYVVEQLAPLGLAYLHIIQGETGGVRHPADAARPFDYDALRRQFPGAWMVNNGYSRDESIEAVATGATDLVAFGRPFISNPDLVRRLRGNAPLNELVANRLYGGGAEGYTDYPTLAFAFAAERCIGSALALLLVLKLSGRPLQIPSPRATVPIGLTQVAAFMIFQTWALVEGGPGKTAVLIFTMPIWTLMMSSIFLGERIRGKQWLAALSTLAGLLLIIEPWDMHTSALSKGLGLMAAFCWAAGSILVKRLRSTEPVDLLSLTAWQMVIGAVPLTLLALIVPERPTEWSMHYVGILAFMSVASTALCWWLWIYILDRVPAWEASLPVLGTPVIAILSSRWSLGEEFSRVEIAGILLIGSGLALLSLIGWAASRKKLALAGARAG
jgi:drug/metabolite transporter (DMT)-like permease